MRLIKKKIRKQARPDTWDQQFVNLNARDTICDPLNNFYLDKKLGTGYHPSIPYRLRVYYRGFV